MFLIAGSGVGGIATNLVLTSFVLHRNHDTTGLMGKAYGRLCFIDMLSTKDLFRAVHRVESLKRT